MQGLQQIASWTTTTKSLKNPVCHLSVHSQPPFHQVLIQRHESCNNYIRVKLNYNENNFIEDGKTNLGVLGKINSQVGLLMSSSSLASTKAPLLSTTFSLATLSTAFFGGASDTRVAAGIMGAALVSL
jgi:hypothetical protein